MQGAGALAARCLLMDAHNDGSDAAQLLQHYLRSRQRALAAAAAAAASGHNGSAPSTAASDAVQRLAAQVQSALHDAAALFVDPYELEAGAALTHAAVPHRAATGGSGDDGDTPLTAALAEDSGTAEGSHNAIPELLFDPLEVQEGSDLPDSEDAAWRGALAAAAQRAAPASAGTVGPILMQWLQALPDALEPAFEGFDSCTKLAHCAATVRAAVADWHLPAAQAASSEGNTEAGTVRWDALCGAIVHQQLDLWATVFEPCLQRRATAIVHSGVHDAFAVVASGLATPLAAIAAASAIAAPGSSAAGRTMWEDLAGGAAQPPAAASGHPDTLAPSPRATGTDAAAGAAGSAAPLWHLTAPRLERRLRGALAATLADAAQLLDADGAAHTTLHGANETERGAQLQRCAQAACVEALKQAGTELQRQMGVQEHGGAEDRCAPCEPCGRVGYMVLCNLRWAASTARYALCKLCGCVA